MADTIMVLSGIVFGVLFIFLLFISAVFLISRFVRVKRHEFEPCVSIIIPVYNGENTIKGCIDFIFASGYPKEKTEVIVIDDGSTDKTANIVRKYQGLRLLSQNHLGKSDALNLGAKSAKYDFVLNIDADTLMDRECIKEMLTPFLDEEVGATTANSIIKKEGSMLNAFQNIEYHYNNLIRSSFSRLFENSIWFFGALACYRKSVLEKVGYFKRDTLTEDTDIALEIRKSGFRTVNALNAICTTIVPGSIKELYSQRSRWWMGTLQSLLKNRELFSLKSTPSVLFLFINQFWWSFYAFLSLPLIIYQINYWLPYNANSFSALFSYIFRWFTLAGPAFVIYKIPEWGISYYSIFGVLAGIISTILIVVSIKLFRDRLSLRNLTAVFFYFPYTILLNIIIVTSILHFKFRKKRFFIG